MKKIILKKFKSSEFNKRFIAFFLALIMIFSIIFSQWLISRQNVVSESNKLQSNQEKASVIIERCQNSIHEGDYKEALEDVNQAIELDGANSDYYELRSSVYIQLNQYDEAIKDYKTALSINPLLQELNENIAYLYYEIGNKEQALEYITKAIKNNEINENMLKLSFSIHEEMKDYENVVSDLNGLIKLDSQDPQLYSALADYQVHLQYHSEAAKNYELALKFYSDQTDIDILTAIYPALGSCYVQIEEYEKAITYFNKSLEINTGNTTGISNNSELTETVLLQRAICYYNTKDYSKAVLDFEAYFKLNPEDLEYMIYLARGYYFLNEYEQGINWFEKCADSQLYSTESSYYLGDLHLKKANYQKAISYYNDCIAKKYFEDTCYYNRGICYLSLDDFEAARKDFEVVLKITTDETLKMKAQDVLDQLVY